MSKIQFSEADVAYLKTPVAIRERCALIYDACLSGKGPFSVHPRRLDETVDFVMKVIEENYPDFEVPFHSRWGHFKAGGVDREKVLDNALQDQALQEQVRAKLDLAVVSVLLDAGAGDVWRYTEPTTAATYSRSEGLAVAGFYAFLTGAFSSSAQHPLRVDAAGLASLTPEQLAGILQHGEDNHVPGFQGRLDLLHRLATVMLEDPDRFPDGRPGNLIDHIAASKGRSFSAQDMLTEVLNGFGPIWPNGLKLGNHFMGDVWHHPLLGPEDSASSLVPFHKLSQWLTYSLLEPPMAAGYKVSGVDALTGLAEYRNGGLFVEMGVIQPVDPEVLKEAHHPGSPLIVAWRALTIHLLDQLAERVRAALNLDSTAFPLAKLLEGGTWHAGRRLAAANREGGGPPIRIISDGTVF